MVVTMVAAMSGVIASMNAVTDDIHSRSDAETWLSGFTVLRRYVCFSSRRRHTSCSRDWSSDVCSSDLALKAVTELSLNYKDRAGVFVRGDGLYDFGVMDSDTERTPLSRAAKDLVGSYTRLLDAFGFWRFNLRSEEHTSELQSRLQLVCRLLLGKKQ